MSLEHPLALALLVVPAILLWLRTRADRPRAAEASSLLVWDRVSPGDTVPAKPRPPLAAWIEAAGAALLVIGMAGPLGRPPDSAGPVRVLLDTSASMGAKGPDCRSALAMARESVAKYATSVRVLESSDPERDLASLAGTGGAVVLVTDHRVAPLVDPCPLLRVVGFGGRTFNAGITGVSGEMLPAGGWRILVTVAAFGVQGPVEGVLRVGKEAGSAVTVTPGTPVVIEREVVYPGKSISLSFTGDSLPADDEVGMNKEGGLPVEIRNWSAESGSPGAHLVRALVAAGAMKSGSLDDEPLSLVAQDIWADGPMSSQGPFHVALRILLPSETAGEEVRGDGVVATGNQLANGVHLDPSVTLGARGKMSDVGEAVLLDGKGSLLTTWQEEGMTTACFRFQPGGTWAERDPSFVVLAKNLVDFAAGGPARVEGRGVLDAKETREAAEGETFGDLRAAIEEARRPDPASRTSYSFALLMAGGAALAAAWLAMR